MFPDLLDAFLKFAIDREGACAKELKVNKTDLQVVTNVFELILLSYY
jgi:hypothetical protein